MFDYPKTLLCPFCQSHVYDYMGDAPLMQEHLVILHYSSQIHQVVSHTGVRLFVDGHYVSNPDPKEF